MFNSHFASQCTSINNSSVLPPLKYKTSGRLASVNIKEDDIYLIIKTRSLDDSTLRKSYCRTFTNFVFVFLDKGAYPDDWKKCNTVLNHKKKIKT